MSRALIKNPFIRKGDNGGAGKGNGGGNDEHDSKQLAHEILETYDMIKEKFPGIEASIAELTQKVAALTGLNVKDLADQVEKIKATNELLAKQIRRNGLIPGFGDSKESQQFSLVRAAHAIHTNKWEDAKLEKDVFEQARGFAKSVIGVDSDAGFFVPIEVLADVIPGVYARSILVGMHDGGATRCSVIQGISGGEVRIPEFQGGMISAWTGELKAAEETASKTGHKTMRPHKLTCFTSMSEEMAMLGGMGYEAMFRNDMERSLAAKMDWTALYGRGVEDSPRGVLAVTGIGMFSAETKALVTASPADAAGGELDFDGLDEMVNSMEDANIEPDDTAAVIAPRRYFRRLKKQPVQYYSGQTSQRGYILGAPMLSNQKLSEYIGDFDGSTQIASTNKPGASLGWTTTSTTEKFGDVFYGNWGDLILGIWRAIEMETDSGKGTGFISGRINIKMKLFADFVLRYAKSIVVCPDARIRT